MNPISLYVILIISDNKYFRKLIRVSLMKFCPFKFKFNRIAPQNEVIRYKASQNLYNCIW